MKNKHPMSDFFFCILHFEFFRENNSEATFIRHWCSFFVLELLALETDDWCAIYHGGGLKWTPKKWPHKDQVVEAGTTCRQAQLSAQDTTSTQLLLWSTGIVVKSVGSHRILTRWTLCTHQALTNAQAISAWSTLAGCSAACFCLFLPRTSQMASHDLTWDLEKKHQKTPVWIHVCSASNIFSLLLLPA